MTDADADSDGDGISNREEIDAGANPLNTDTDRDGISDYDEKNTYGTGIALPDSDGDGIEDGEELALGLNPLSTNTNGVADNEYLIQQTVSPDSEALEEVNTVENTYRFSLDGMAAGYIENMDIEESGFAGTVANDAISGMVVELEYDMPVQDMTLFFEIKEEYRDNTSGAYVELSEENAGIGRFTVFFWADAVNMLIPIETQYDYENYTVYAETNYLGTYCLMDRELWYEQLGINPEGDSAVMGAMAVLSESGEIVMSEVSSNAINVISVEETMTDGVISTTDTAIVDSQTGIVNINGEEKEVYFYNGHMYTIYEGPASWLEAREACENAGGHLATINTAEEQAFFEDVILAADVAQRYWIGGYSEGYPYEFKWITEEPFTYTNWVSGEPNYTFEFHLEIYGHYNNWYGQWNNVPGDSITKAYICEWEYIERGTELYNGLTYEILPRYLGVILQGSTEDHDADGLLDLEEIYIEHELFDEPNEKGEYECPTLGEVLEYVYERYDFVMPTHWGLNNLVNELMSKKVMICLSNPVCQDSDEDGLIDGTINDVLTVEEIDAMIQADEIVRDTAPLERGLLNGVVGNLRLVSAANFPGHTFLMYCSYVNDELDTSDLYGAYEYDEDDGEWEFHQEEDYDVESCEYISIGGAGDIENDKFYVFLEYLFPAGTSASSGSSSGSSSSSSSSTSGSVMAGSGSGESIVGAEAAILLAGMERIEGGVFINRELYCTVIKENYGTGYYCVMREVTENQIDELLEYMEDNNYYIFFTHNCAVIAVGAWQEVFDEDYSGYILGVMAPSEVYNAMRNDVENEISPCELELYLPSR